MKKGQIYIELKDKSILISRLKVDNNKYFFKNVKKSFFKNLEIKNGVPYNLSSIYLKVKDYLEKNKLSKNYIVICIPGLLYKNKSIQKLIVLQIALCICKTNLKIYKVIDQTLLPKEDKMPKSNFFYKKDLDNRLDFFKTFSPDKKNFPSRWILTSIVLFLLMLTTSLQLLKNKKSTLSVLKQENIKLTEKTKALKRGIEEFNDKKKKKLFLEKKLKKVKNNKNQQTNPLDKLLAISKSIPPDCILESIKIENSQQKNNKLEPSAKNKRAKKKEHILICGNSLNQKSISIFAKNLSKSPFFRKLEIIKIQKDKKMADSNTYKFKILSKFKMPESPL